MPSGHKPQVRAAEGRGHVDRGHSEPGPACTPLILLAKRLPPLPLRSDLWPLSTDFTLPRGRSPAWEARLEPQR